MDPYKYKQLGNYSSGRRRKRKGTQFCHTYWWCMSFLLILYSKTGLESLILKIHIIMLSYSVVSDSLQLWTVARQAPLSMGFFRQEYWNWLPFPSTSYYSKNIKQFLSCIMTRMRLYLYIYIHLTIIVVTINVQITRWVSVDPNPLRAQKYSITWIFKIKKNIMSGLWKNYAQLHSIICKVL